MRDKRCLSFSNPHSNLIWSCCVTIFTPFSLHKIVTIFMFVLFPPPRSNLIWSCCQLCIQGTFQMPRQRTIRIPRALQCNWLYSAPHKHWSRCCKKRFCRCRFLPLQMHVLKCGGCKTRCILKLLWLAWGLK